MGQYCDSKVLESHWFNWLVASSVPELERYREAGLLATKIIGRVTVQTNTGIKVSPDPIHFCRAHCIMVEPLIYLNSYNGKLSKPHTFKRNKPITCKLPVTLKPADESLRKKLLDDGYFMEKPTIESWHKMLIDIMKICTGIASKFNLSNEEAKQDLANDALHQVSLKIKNRRLVYIPGRAPVFNLLTTTIHRIIFSILNKETKERLNRAKHGQLVGPLLGYRHSRGRVCTKRVMGVLVGDQRR